MLGFSPKNERLQDIEDTKIAKIAGAIGLGLMAILAITDPFTPKGVTLKDAQLNQELTCLREHFKRTATPHIYPQLSSECDYQKLEQLSAEPDPLSAITSARDKVFAASGLPPQTEEWRTKRGEFQIKINR